MTTPIIPTPKPKKLAQPIHLILDWDGTLTRSDTLSVLARIPEARDKRLGKPRSSSPDWSEFTKAYLDDYSKHKQAHYPSTADPEAYSQWLASLKAVEQASAKRISDSAFFKGCTTADVDNVAKTAIETGEVRLRKGAFGLFGLFVGPEPPAGSKLSILSVNFSETFIRRCLHRVSERLVDPAGLPVFLEALSRVEIRANEIEGLDDPDGSSGRLAGSLQTAADKLENFPPATNAQKVIYVGDSATDYECIRRAKPGVWICDCPQNRVVERAKETFKPLDCTMLPLGEGKEGIVDSFWARDLEAVSKYVGALL
ncbi:hypothetical protein B0A50_04923 [Salinomyces thailandicus]|uniref:Uncharacterized protein n=1 Tax=Salinomyces thailandicus TaxID=706561 RepID=A0A4U0U072_9PEZI|nr:hypothetical protein B0A50_04923 [Salinomyces thailandica]